MAHKPRTERAREIAVSDEAAAYIADALMQLALDFDNNHFSQIRRHYEAITPATEHDPRQLELFPQPEPWLATRRRGNRT
jgi:hypothetical protein